ncbi:TRAP transporter small permease [Oribacterium sp. WCC10]|uniref:TRAP transporter small permease n=1 Tax=Oribacterium sp. WCC10 TaxID=1855343 RepID=UPI0008EE5C33|nr:TRAP transporter small permease [Oribacterium sp. WCC10]SFG09151.1 TRAP-type C4-dicarboxylate transport system, small permease component [Oribacterium sp. WCC10]
MKQLRKYGRCLFNVYFNIGVIALALLAVSVCFAVIMRYFFSKSWKELSEFNVTLFAFTTFWGMGINVIKGEHVMIDILYNSLKPGIKKILNIVNLIIMLIVDLVFTVQGFNYVAMAGKQISMGMEIPMKYMYGIMPVSGVICAICIIVKLIEVFLPEDQAEAA